MHFSIPATTELYGESTTGTTYTGYNIYINGTYHCCLRYKQLHALHEELRRRCANLNVQLPAFPPKRLLPLTNGQLESRRVGLERFLQLVGQDTKISNLEFFQNYMLNAQQESAVSEGTLDDYEDYTQGRAVEVVLMNGYQLQVNCNISDNATALLQKVCNSVHLSTHMVPYFCLYLMRRDTNDSLLFLRRLSDFESPYLSRLQNRPCQIVLRKGYWNGIYDFKLMKDPIALNLLFIQTVSDVEREWVIATPEIRRKLRSLHDHGMKKEYMEMAIQLPLYGCLQFYATQVDYPEVETNALISIGNKELSLRIIKGDRIYETKFRVTRMRCWRVTAIHTTPECKDVPSDLTLAFEYLMSKQTLRWIKITSAQAMLMSACLQAMVDELLITKDSNNSSSNTATPDDGKTTENSPTNHSPPNSSSSVRNGRFSQSTISNSSSTPSFSNELSSTATTNSNSSSTGANSPTTIAPVQFLTQRRKTKQNSKIATNSYSAVFFRNDEESVQNEAFEGIGDDDL